MTDLLLEIERVYLALVLGLFTFGLFTIYWQLRPLQEQIFILSRRAALASAFFVGWSVIFNALALVFFPEQWYIVLMTQLRVIVATYMAWIGFCIIKAYWQRNGQPKVSESNTEHDDQA